MKLRLLYVLLTILLLTTSCNKEVVEIQDNTKGNLTFSIDKINTPQNVTEIVLHLTRKDYETKTGIMNLVNDTTATLSINDIKIGTWHLKIDALDKNSTVIYSGETDVEITANTTTPVNIRLNPITGSVTINVTWPAIQQEKLVAHYTFSGNANDESDFGNHGTVMGATPTTDRFGNTNSAYLFDGIDDYIKIPDANSLTPSGQKLTISLWVKNNDTQNKVLIYKGSENNNREYSVGISKSQVIGFSVNNHGLWKENQIGLETKNTLKNNSWTFYTATWDGIIMKVYINGVLENTRVANATVDNLMSDLFIGTYGGDINRYAFKGIMDDIRIYNYAISEEKIKELYHENGWTGNPQWKDYSTTSLIPGNSSYMHPIVLKEENAYKMYFIEYSTQGYDIYLATSDDGLTWSKERNTPVLNRGETGSWDDRNVSAGAVLKKDGVYFMYYTGRSTAEDVQSAWHIGLATSNDGINWTKYPEPLISGKKGSWELKIGVSSIKVINNKYYMYYTGKTELDDHKIGLATSSDGISWTKYENNPIMVPDKNWEGTGIYYASIIEEDGKLKMVYQNSYNNHTSAFGMAYSTDGINWTKDDNNPIFTENDTKNNYSMILYPNFHKVGNEYRIYYTGKDARTHKYSINVAIKK